MMSGESTIKIEAEVARRHSPAVAWPTIIFLAMLWLTLVVSTWLAINDQLPLLAASMINLVVLYCMYTPLHDAVHSAIVARNPELRWINTALGMAAAAPIWMFFHHHRKSHFLHHAKTNMPEDPDSFAMGGFARVLFIKTPWSLINYFNPVTLYRDCRRLRLGDGERRLTMALFALQALAALAIVFAGYGLELVTLWLVPWFIGVLLMQVSFGWAPHHDHSETGRYRDTRISLFPGADWLLLFQNLHLVHHMLPSVPFYRYRAVFDELRPVLESHGARIEGFWPYSPVRA
jgi:fatty acid desaturase